MTVLLWLLFTYLLLGFGMFLLLSQTHDRWTAGGAILLGVIYAAPFALLIDAVVAPILTLFSSGKIPQDSAESNTVNHKENDNA